jgi:hypothetical protein
VTYSRKELYVDALEERIDTVERDVDDETYHMDEELPVSKLGDRKLVIAEKRPIKTRRIRSSASPRTKSRYRSST